MELYATGFNAWNQLRVADPLTGWDDEPDDMFRFTCVFADEAIRDVRPALTYTRVDSSHGPKTAGRLPPAHAGIFAGETSLPASRRAPLHFAEAANGVVVVVYDDDDAGSSSIHQSPSLAALGPGAPWTTFPGFPRLRRVVAYETGFAALAADGRVWTWGDGRYPACLGRDVTAETPADKPGLVAQLADLPTGPVAQIAAGGYLLAALTAGDDLYSWGGHPGQAAVLDVSGEPAPVVVEEHDIRGVAVGSSHVVVLTTTGDVFAIGDNGNGQLGVGRETRTATAWTRVEVPLRDGQQILAVAAGPRSSLLTVGGAR